MYCTNCGNQIKDDAIYCERCASKVKILNVSENNNAKYISMLTDNIKKAQTASLIGIIMSVISQAALMVAVIFIKEKSSSMIESVQKDIILMTLITFLLFTVLNIFSFVVLMRKRVQLSGFSRKFFVNSDLEYAKEYFQNFKISSVKVVLVLNIVAVAVTSFILVLFNLAQIIACIYIKKLCK